MAIVSSRLGSPSNRVTPKRRSQSGEFPVDQRVDAAVQREHDVGRRWVAPQHIDARVRRHVRADIGHGGVDDRHRPAATRRPVPGFERSDILVEAGRAIFGLGEKFKAIAPVDRRQGGKGGDGVGEAGAALVGGHVDQPAVKIIIGFLLCAFALHLAHDQKGQAQYVGIEMHTDPWRHGHVSARVERRHHFAL